MISVDTNVLLRYLVEPVDVRNPSWQVIAARNIIHNSDAVFISDIVLAEIEWVLESAFEFTSNEIYGVIQALANNSRFTFEDWSAVQCALLDYRESTTVDLSDRIIARRSINKGAKTLYTLEKKSNLGGLSCATTLKKPTKEMLA
ncbi:MAG: PIN domain-containing protein [Thiohalomonadales bacterium]